MLYIAYGSNLNRSQMALRCPTADLVGPAAMQGYALQFRGWRHSAVATVEPLANSTVPVLLWDIRDRDEQSLNRYEGWPHVYHKELLLIEFEGSTLPAMAYIMNDGRAFGAPSDAYLETIRQGYVDAGFDLDTLDRACERSMDQAVEADRLWEESLEQLQTDFDELKWW